jgi:ribosome assembly protein 1
MLTPPYGRERKFAVINTFALLMCRSVPQEEEAELQRLEEQQEEDAFAPARCDVAFGSAQDGWAFTLDQFAAMYSQKLGCK